MIQNTENKQSKTGKIKIKGKKTDKDIWRRDLIASQGQIAGFQACNNRIRCADWPPKMIQGGDFQDGSVRIHVSHRKVLLS